MTETATPPDTPEFERRLSRTRLITRAGVILERVWPLALPLVIIFSLFLSLSWFGLFRLMPDMARIGLGALLAFSALAALFPFRFMRNPTDSEVDRRIEHANALAHTPVLVQTDRLAGKTDSFADALWREHRRRMAGTLSAMHVELPRTSVPARDPFALRAVAALMLVAGFAFSLGPFGGRITDIITPRAVHLAPPARIDAWVTPPAYTNRPPVFLTVAEDAQPLSHTVPEGTDVTVRVTGGDGAETLGYTHLDGNTRDLQAGAAPRSSAPSSIGTAPRQFAGKLSEDGVLSLKSGEQELGRWAFSILPDGAPQISFTEQPKRAANGSLELNYSILDDYGAASAEAGFTLAEPPAENAHPLYAQPEMKLSLPGRSDEKGIAKTIRDLSEHVWAGASVKITLKVIDAAGQEAASEPRTFTLPERPFSNPLARAVLEQRRILALDANRKPRVLDLLDAITLRPEDTFSNMSHYLALMSARTRLDMATTDDQLRDVVAYLWAVALGIEEGDLSAAQRRLSQAQDALKQALKDGASNEEIDKLMQELRQAMAEFLKELAQRAEQNPNTAMPSPDQQMLRENDLQRLMDQIENLAKSGSRDQAEQLLSQLQEMMNNLQAGRPQQGKQGQNAQNNEMRKQMDKLGEIMRRQQETMNETFRMDQMQRNQRGEQGETPQGGGKPMTPEEFAEAMKQLQDQQGKLQGDLEGLQKGLEGMGMKPGEGLGEAGDAMGDAGKSLGKGRGEQAVGDQGRALEALRKGAQDMMQQMQAMQGEKGGSGEGGRQQSSDRDPLGRPRATTGPDFGESVKLPDEIDVQRARQILEAIRKRLGNALSPELEKDYLERLLDLK
ncbi:TIGR02302 family protein [Mesorhizobium sp. NBSH29]|uniref:TIGR02302 family protein n=1 Tax=Mesorhizobium sp. NBSH29 TaxID=2654249 RepID=UPI001896970C|nr:TIGR02302 family protein [Mesorhizobium sp. NBSH29]QPC85666.1 TIGR02302 family protein [Mesorhizobium sp. NBSH29]